MASFKLINFEKAFEGSLVMERTKGMRPGDWVVYRKSKFGVIPGPRAKDVAPVQHGDGYSYLVEKFWVVSEQLSDGRLRLRTRRGKEHIVRPDDANLRAARWWERLLYRDRFQAVQNAAADAIKANAN